MIQIIFLICVGSVTASIAGVILILLNLAMLSRIIMEKGDMIGWGIVLPLLSLTSYFTFHAAFDLIG